MNKIEELKAALAASTPGKCEAVEALEKMKASFEDLLNGYPERELHEPYQVTLNRAAEVLENKDDQD